MSEIKRYAFNEAGMREILSPAVEAKTMYVREKDHLASHALLQARCRELESALGTLVAIVGLTAFKYEAQREVLQEAVDLATKALSTPTSTEHLNKYVSEHPEEFFGEPKKFLYVTDNEEMKKDFEKFGTIMGNGYIRIPLYLPKKPIQT